TSLTNAQVAWQKVLAIGLPAGKNGDTGRALNAAKASLTTSAFAVIAAANAGTITSAQSLAIRTAEGNAVVNINRILAPFGKLSRQNVTNLIKGAIQFTARAIAQINRLGGNF